MNRAALLSPMDVNVIRRYVHTKYAPLPDERRAQIVADAIRRSLQMRLPNLPTVQKNKLAQELISRCLVTERREVQADDVLDLCSELEWGTEEEREQLQEPLLYWLNERSKSVWTPTQLNERLMKKNGPQLIVAEQAVTQKPVTAWTQKLVSYVRSRTFTQVAAILLSIILVTSIVISQQRQTAISDVPLVSEHFIPETNVVSEAGKQAGSYDFLKYTEIDENAIKTYMRGRDALLAEEPYFGAIIESAKMHDVHPLLLFAITGQEQGFVPRTNKNAKEIANNPFNVFHSWQDYNTDIYNSADIAAKLIAKLAAGIPEDQDPFEWMNKTYAEDPLWSDGVRKLFNKLTSLNSK
ncbi:MAG: hypothetical protein P0Y55_07380 [Candidatus Cohnella colombiensis]|uniref:Uncharacterized protein n=1 Tax=Candidatus Cohnella colombiensis TaxID=3121368 RepID=A0AA95EYJ8_9BACL|nr:MAG: hypothetical protein P0Y55_07380 [Cohnella sp.]